MEKDIKLKLSVNDISNLIKDMKKLSQEFKNLNDIVSKELAEATQYQLEQNYSTMPFLSNTSMPHFGVTKTHNGYSVYARGDNIVYEEFGTGDVGESHPYPIPQSDFGLKGYNTGETIRDADGYSAKQGITSGKYWTYWDGKDWVYTQGIPSGKFVFNTSEWLHENYKDLIQKKVDDVISKV